MKGSIIATKEELVKKDVVYDHQLTLELARWIDSAEDEYSPDVDIWEVQDECGGQGGSRVLIKRCRVGGVVYQMEYALFMDSIEATQKDKQCCCVIDIKKISL